MEVNYKQGVRMITVDELRRIGRVKGITNLGYAEKDYLSDIILLSISRRVKDELVFKGGTCLFKFYKLDRFSEDLDFTLQRDLNIEGLIEKISHDLNIFGAECKIKEVKRVYNTVMITLKIKGPLYTGEEKTLATMRIDINTKSGIELKPLLHRYTPLYSDVPSFSIFIMHEKEILAEKIRAILTRTKAKDIYDVWFLLKKGVEFDLELIKKKLEYYELEWDKKAFINAINKPEIWETELEPLLKTLPKFNEVRKFIHKKVKMI